MSDNTPRGKAQSIIMWQAANQNFTTRVWTIRWFKLSELAAIAASCYRESSKSNSSIKIANVAFTCIHMHQSPSLHGNTLEQRTQCEPKGLCWDFCVVILRIRDKNGKNLGPNRNDTFDFRISGHVMTPPAATVAGRSVWANFASPLAAV